MVYANRSPNGIYAVNSFSAKRILTVDKEGQGFGSNLPPHFFARIPEVRFCVSPFFFVPKVNFRPKKAVIRTLAAVSKRVSPL